MSIIPLIKYDALDICTVDLSQMDGSDKVTVLISLEAAVISKLRDKYPEDLNEEINFILDQKTFEPKSILKYDGKIKIRSDVLEKLKRISNLMENQSNLKLQEIKIMVKDSLCISILTPSTRRTFDKYVKSISDCIFSCLGKRPSLYERTDCSCFIEIVNEKLSEEYS